MPQETTTATKDAWTAFPARPAGQPIGELVAVGTDMSPSVVHPADYPGVALRIPQDTRRIIETLTREALDTADVSNGLPSFDDLAADTAFGVDRARLMKGSGLDDLTASVLARWGSALFAIVMMLRDRREQADWHATKHARDVRRQATADAIDDVALRRHHAGGRAFDIAGAKSMKKQRLHRPDIVPADNHVARMARVETYQLQGRFDRLFRPLPVGLAALLDPTGWRETVLMLVGEGAMTKPEAEARQRHAVGWILERHGDRPAALAGSLRCAQITPPAGFE